MTDQTIAVDKVEEVRDLHRDAAKMTTITDAEREIHQHVAAAMESLLPPPDLPTLADMTLEERRECQWMQADSEAWGRVIIVDPDRADRTAALIDRQGMAYGSHTSVTPRPDLPRMEWPGELSTLKVRLESALSRLEDKWDCKINSQTCTAEQQNAALVIATAIRKELES